MDELYVIARRALLDALDALGPHRDAVIVVGAQALYLRVGESEFAVAPYTEDADLDFRCDPPLGSTRFRSASPRPGFPSRSVGPPR